MAMFVFPSSQNTGHHFMSLQQAAQALQARIQQEAGQKGGVPAVGRAPSECKTYVYKSKASRTYTNLPALKTPGENFGAVVSKSLSSIFSTIKKNWNKSRQF